VEALIAMFKTANLLLLAEDYSLANGLFEKVLTYFPSPEVSNNIGTALMLEAMNLGRYNSFKYVLPIEIDWNFRLRKPSLIPGQKEFEPEIIRKREFLFKKADIVYKNMLIQHPEYISGWINLACLKILKSDLMGAQLILKEAIKKKGSNEYLETIKMLRGTILLIENKKSKALNEFTGIQSPWLKNLIKQNQQPGTIDKSGYTNCTLNIPLKKILPSALMQEKTIKLDTIYVTWNKERYSIRTLGSKREFVAVELDEKLINACTPVKSFSQGAQKWSGTLISIINPVDKKRSYYTIQ